MAVIIPVRGPDAEAMANVGLLHRGRGFGIGCALAESVKEGHDILVPRGTVLTRPLLEEIPIIAPGTDFIAIEEWRHASGYPENSETENPLMFCGLTQETQEQAQRSILRVASSIVRNFSPGKTRNDAEYLINNIVRHVVESESAIRAVRLLSSFDVTTCDHSIGVAVAGLALLRELSNHGVITPLSFDHYVSYATGALFHDLGKIFVPQEILNKKTRLTNEEFSVIQNHPWDGDACVRHISSHFAGADPSIVAKIVGGHHFQDNDRGYGPVANKSEIDIFVQVAILADAFDAMTSVNRGYRPPMQNAMAFREMLRNPQQFDPLLVNFFFRHVASQHPENSVILAQDGSIGVVRISNFDGGSFVPLAAMSAVAEEKIGKLVRFQNDEVVLGVPIIEVHGVNVFEKAFKNLLESEKDNPGAPLKTLIETVQNHPADIEDYKMVSPVGAFFEFYLTPAFLQRLEEASREFAMLRTSGVTIADPYISEAEKPNRSQNSVWDM